MQLDGRVFYGQMLPLDTMCSLMLDIVINFRCGRVEGGMSDSLIKPLDKCTEDNGDGHRYCPIIRIMKIIQNVYFAYSFSSVNEFLKMNCVLVGTIHS